MLRCFGLPDDIMDLPKNLERRSMQLLSNALLCPSSSSSISLHAYKSLFKTPRSPFPRSDFSKSTLYKIGWFLIEDERRVAISTSKTLFERSSECSDSFFETKSRTSFMLSLDSPQLDIWSHRSVFLLLSSSDRIVSSK